MDHRMAEPFFRNEMGGTSRSHLFASTLLFTQFDDTHLGEIHYTLFDSWRKFTTIAIDFPVFLG